MNHRKTAYIIIAFVFLSILSNAQIPNGYYNATIGLCGEELRQKLYETISAHTTISYGNLWDIYESTDLQSNGKIWDMYSDCDFTVGSDQCGNYNSECDCYNREHSMPASWFNDASPMYTDLFHIYPTDGWVNNKRGSLPFGEVNNSTYTSGNGSKIGNCSYPGYSGTVFEPIDEYKGDFARSYFYMLTAYKNRVSAWDSEMFSGSDFTSWAKNMLLEWNQADPVSEKEIARNNAVYNIQHNRNPFIDCPDFAEAIWSSNCNITCFTSLVNEENASLDFSIILNQEAKTIDICFENNEIPNSIEIYNILGSLIISTKCDYRNINISAEKLTKGTYFVRAKFASENMQTKKIIMY